MQAIALRENPVMKSSNARKKLLGFIMNLRELACPLAILDTPIALNERIHAWKEAAGDEVGPSCCSIVCMWCLCTVFSY